LVVKGTTSVLPLAHKLYNTVDSTSSWPSIKFQIICHVVGKLVNVQKKITMAQTYVQVVQFNDEHRLCPTALNSVRLGTGSSI
jgi:hypothetical protein